ncbi:MAG: PAS domain-containing sensor histidine kinase [Pseudomonadota bacterium]
MITLIVAIELTALGIKAFDDRNKANVALQTSTHREALAVAEYMAGKVDLVSLTLSHGYRAGWSTNETAQSLPELDAVVEFADALSAATGTRLHEAGAVAAVSISKDPTLGLSALGDFVITYKPASGPVRLGLVPTETWLPAPAENREFSLVSGGLDGVTRLPEQAIQACTPLKPDTVSVCVETPQPIIGRAELLSLASYGFLVLGPALALIGLLKLLEQRSGESEAFEGQATRAGRVLETVLQEAKAGFWSWDFNQKRLWLSTEAATLLDVEEPGYFSVEELKDKIHADHQEVFVRSVETLPDKGFISQVFATTKRTAWLDMRARPDPESGEINGILLDVTDMRAAIARTKQAEQRLRSALEGFSGPFALWDKRKRLIYWNKAFAGVFGLDKLVRAGMSHETVKLAQASGIAEQRPSHEESNSEIVRTKDGQWFKMVERQTGHGGMITMGLDVSADVENEVQLTSQQKKLKQLVKELERSRRLAGDLTTKLQNEKQKAERSANSKSAFLANMSHELRTPLNAINGFSEILANEMYGPIGNDRYREYAGDILASGQHLLDMINDILDMAKVEAGKMTIDPRPLDLIEPVDAAVRMIRRKAEDKGITLTLSASEGLPPVDADHRAIRQMILNLVSNAIKFTDEGGGILVKIDQVDDTLRVMVRDSGVGIPAEALPRLAEPFEQVSDTRDRNYDGSGLGLALTKSFAEMHGGRLTIASKEGKGTLISFFIPISADVEDRSVA